MNESAVIFDIQRFSLHDGPGIRTTVFLKGCSLRCLWCQNPESQSLQPEIAFYREYCQECYRCEASCSQGAIIRGKHARISYEQCNACQKCVAVCNTRALRLIGKTWSVQQLYEEILKDRDFFEDSQGGVTFSGGEPLIHSAFLASLLPLLKQAGIHVTVETSGLFQWQKISPLLPYLDLIYFDLKHTKATLHQKFTKQSNKKILENFEKLTKVFPAVQPRMPVIPGINDDAETLKAVALLLKSQGYESIHCLPYHNLGESKIPRLNTQMKPLHLQSLDIKNLELIQRTFKKEGIHAVIYD
ncbi:glycyl-radical enzyme activating protein [Deltaproteobacteria bacterium TL4]